MVAFFIWFAAGLLFVGIGIYDFFSRKQVGFFSNTKPVEVKDVKKYNVAVGKLFCAFGLGFILLGLPLLGDENSPLIFLSIFGVMAEIMALVIVYLQVIEKKHRK